MISRSQIDNIEALAPFLRENLDRLQQSLESYGSDDMNFELWICNLFFADLDAICDEDQAEDDLIELRTMQMLRSDFNSKNVVEFWCSLTQAYLRLVKKARVALYSFATTTTTFISFK